MSDFILNTNIPSSGDNPSDDQPIMLANTQALNGWSAVDHVGFNAANGGTHTQITYSSENVPGGLPSDPMMSIAYTGPGQTDAAHSQHYWANSLGRFALSAVRAFGTFTTGAGGTTPALIASYNVNSISYSATSHYVITLTANTTIGNNPIILVSSRGNVTFSYSFVGGVLTITTLAPSPIANTSFDFLIIQI